MDLKIALAGNPNSGKTTLFNALTGSNQFVGNWPGVTVEKKEGRLKGAAGVTLTDLPGIYSLSPYTMEEVVARNYLIDEHPDAILNIVDGTNLERNLYLTTQLAELGIPVVVAINMMDVVRRQGDSIDIALLSQRLGFPVIEISALKGTGITEAANAAVAAAHGDIKAPMHIFSGAVEHAIAHIEEAAVHDMPPEQQRWYAIKIFERDARVLQQLNIDPTVLSHIESDIRAAEQELDDDAESIITNERYLYVERILRGGYKKRNMSRQNLSDKIDRVVTNRFAALPIFALVMFLVYFISVTTVGTWATDWANDGLFGEGWHLFGIGSTAYEEDMTAYATEHVWTDDVKLTVYAATAAGVTGADDIKNAIDARDFAAFEEAYGTYAAALTAAGFDISEAVDAAMEQAPTPADYPVYVPGIPVLIGRGLDAAEAPVWLSSLVLDGIVGGVGAVLGFVPQILVLFLLLSFLEACGYMSRIAFVMDRICRKFGLSGKSIIPMLIGTGCGVPGIMASRTIENERDRRMTITTTTFIPCGAKLPIIAMIAGVLFDDAWWVAPSAYFVGMAAIVISGIMLKKTPMFRGKPAPFVMELPAYRMPTAINLWRSVWERGSSFVKKAGTVILLASIVIWAGSVLGVVDGKFAFDVDMALENSLLGLLGSTICWIFTPLGFGNIKATVATLMGLVAKEEIVGVFGVLDFGGMGQLAAYSFMVFNLLCAPCFAAMGAIRREMQSGKWTAFAIGYQCSFAYAISLMIFQFGRLFADGVTGAGHVVGLVFASLVLAGMLFMMMLPYSESEQEGAVIPTANTTPAELQKTR